MCSSGTIGAAKGCRCISTRPEANVSEWYFAYGSNLCVEQVADRIGPILQGDDRPRVARLPGHRLVFNMRESPDEVFANIMPA